MSYLASKTRNGLLPQDSTENTPLTMAYQQDTEASAVLDAAQLQVVQDSAEDLKLSA